MPLEQRDKELAALGASIGSNCRPCVDHHIPAAREAGVSETELAEPVATARAVRDQAVGLLASRVEELLDGESIRRLPDPLAGRSRDHELVAIGASVGANAHSLLEAHVASALALGLTSAQVGAALAMAEHVQRRAAEMTAAKGATTLEKSSGAGPEAGAPLAGNAGEVKR
jgi:4-carboxymuconolactone decarboxylase